MRKYMIGIVVGVLLSSVVVVLAGQIDSPAGPTAAGGQMYTLEQIYDRLNDGAAATKMTTFTEPSSGPASTMKTLDEIYALVGERAQVPKTGQTTSYADYDDGYYEKGVAWPSPRFTDNSDGTVTDNLTGLIWLKDAHCMGLWEWADALTQIGNLNTGTDFSCNGYTAGAFSDWRLPSVKELNSLTDLSQYNPALPGGRPFTGVHWHNYWSSTTKAYNASDAWHVIMNHGFVGCQNKGFDFYVWPVRGGQ